MSENYGDCKRCKGAGKVIIIRRDCVLLTTKKIEIECVACTGTGHDSSADTYNEIEKARDCG